MGENFSPRVQLNVIIDDLGDAALIKVVAQDRGKTDSLCLNIFYYWCFHKQSTSISCWKYSTFYTQKSSLISGSYKLSWVIIADNS
jgi:hypothetical protein